MSLIVSNIYREGDILVTTLYRIRETDTVIIFCHLMYNRIEVFHGCLIGEWKSYEIFFFIREAVFTDILEELYVSFPYTEIVGIFYAHR